MDSATSQLIEQYRWLIPYQPVSLHQVIDQLTNKLHATQIEYEQIPNLRMHMFNAVHLPLNEELKLTETQLRLKAIKIPITCQTSCYVEKDFVSLVGKEAEDYIYLAYEEQVGYHYSNSRWLFLEAALMQGIAQADIDMHGEVFMDFAFCLKNFDELYHSVTSK